MRSSPRYEIQVKHRIYGWGPGGNWPTRTRSEGLESLHKCANAFGKYHSYRLVRLIAKPIAVRKKGSKR